MELLIIRHPETIKNAKGILEDQLSGILTKKGLAQIPKIIYKLRKYNPDLIFSSDSRRCRLIAETISKEKRVSVTYNKIFREIDNGEWSGKNKKEAKELNKKGEYPKNGESIKELKKRCKNSLKIIKENDSKTAILISHGLFIR